jgi:nucleotide-binding universal stress UspA family protein
LETPDYWIALKLVEGLTGKGDLLVISTHPHKWFRRLACGSNEKELLRRVACPVLLVHEDKHSFYSLN